MLIFFFFSSRRRHTRCSRDWSSDVCSSDLAAPEAGSAVYLASFGSCRINNRAEVLYYVQYAGEGVTELNEWGVYFGPYSAAYPTMRDGEPAPTFGPGVTMCRVAGIPVLGVLNDVGDVIGPTQMAGPGGVGDNKVLLWLRRRVLQRSIPLLRSGSAVDGRTVYAADECDFGDAYGDATGGADGEPQGC